MEKEELRRPLKVFGWAVIITGIFLHSVHLALYFTDAAFAVGLFLLWLDVYFKRKNAKDATAQDEIYRQRIWKQEQPLLMIITVGFICLAISNIPVMYQHYLARNIIRNLVFFVIGICFIWLLVLLIRREFGKASRTTQKEKETLHQIHTGIQQKKAARQKGTSAAKTSSTRKSKKKQTKKKNSKRTKS